MPTVSSAVLSATVLSAAALFLLPASVTAQDDFEAPYFHEYEPVSSLVVPQHPKTRSKHPFVDVHNHQWRMAEGDLSEIVANMDALNMGVLVNLSGRGGDSLKAMVENGRRHAPGRFAVFTNIDFDGIDLPGWIESTVAQIEIDVRHGASGLKIYKSQGMGATDSAGERIPVNHPNLDPVWAKCGELGIPVLIHTADPHQFWLPKNGDNERLFELMERPRRQRDPAVHPSWETLISEQHDVFRKHPETTFINAHLGWMGHDLARLGRLLDELPNVHTEIGAVLAELGRQPRNARRFFIRYQDRILFGKDSWNPPEYHVYFRVLETDDEYFDYYRKRHGLWKIYGLDLPDEVLKKVYYQNALRIIPGLDTSLFPRAEAAQN